MRRVWKLFRTCYTFGLIGMMGLLGVLGRKKK